MKDEKESSICSYGTASKSYKAFMAAILRQKSKYDFPESLQPGVLTSLYIDCFLIYKKKICSEIVVSAGLCEQNKFSQWRSEQRRLGNLQWETQSIGQSVVKYVYSPGPKIQKYLDKVASEHGMFATKDYVQDQIQQLRQELMGVVSAIKEDYFSKCPPWDDNRDQELESNIKQGKLYIDADVEKYPFLKFSSGRRMHN